MSFSSVSTLNSQARRVLVRARLVLPVVRAPIPNGAMLVAGSELVEVGSWKELRHAPHDELHDLGEVIVLPGLINAHCHLDYTDMAGQLSPPRLFPDWIKGMLALKAHWSYSDYAASWLHGARMLVHNGVTTVADVEAVPELLPEVRLATPLRVCSLLEMTGVRSRRPPAVILEETLARILELPGECGWAGLSPHAPYSTSPELLRLSAEAARQRHWPLATHVAESAEEFEMYIQGRGPMFEWLQTQRAMSDCGHGSPVQHLHRLGALGENLLAVHANYLAPGDADLLGLSRSNVVHCPRSHVYFGHAAFPRQELAAAGVNICLGTDSLATVRVEPRQEPELDLFAEMRAMWEREPALPAEALIRFATVNGALALGMAGRLGELSAGAAADLVSLPFSGKTSKVYEAVVRHGGPVAGVMINGQWARRAHD
jgi:aminodeoxyfutalosine deaminase